MSLKEKFTDKVCSMYNTEMFFIDDCAFNKSKYNKDTQLRDLQLDIFLEENNIHEVKGCFVPYCDKSKVSEKEPLEITHLIGV